MFFTYLQYAFIRETDYTANAHFTSSTPDCSRRSFLYSHPPLHAEGNQFYTPQVQRRNLGQNQSSPALHGSGRGERGSRVLSLTQEGIFHLEGVCDRDESPVGGGQSSEEEEQRANEDGIQFATTHSSSQSSFGSDGYSSPSSTTNFHTPLQPRPQSSTTLRDREGTPGTGIEGTTAFDRNRSMSYPSRRRPSSARNASHQRQGVHSVVEGSMCQSFDSGLAEETTSGLAASSETSIASNDSALQYSTIGVSAFCILEAVRTMLDHQ